MHSSTVDIYKYISNQEVKFKLRENSKLLYGQVPSVVLIFVWCSMLLLLLKLENRAARSSGCDEEFGRRAKLRKKSLTCDVACLPSLNTSVQTSFQSDAPNVVAAEVVR